MRIWIESSFDNLPQEGFRKQRFWLMAEAFVRAGHEVVYWTGDFNHGTKAKRVLKDETGGRIGLRLIPVMPYGRNVCVRRIRSHRRYARDLRAAMLKESAAPDVVIASTPALGPAAVSLEAARHFGAKAVIDVMDAWPETFYRLLPRGFKWLGAVLFAGMRMTARRIYRGADLVTGVCERYRELTGRDDYYLAYHGIEREADDIQAPVRPRAGSVKLVYAGNLGNGYDLGTVIAETRLHPNWLVEIAGRGPNEEKWKAMAGKAVTFHGYLDGEGLKELLRSADIGIIPMRDDSWVGLPYKLGDYAKANLKIVSSLHGETEAMINRHKCGCCYEEGNGGSFARAVKFAARRDGSAEILSELDAVKIYDGYVKRVEGLK